MTENVNKPLSKLKELIKIRFNNQENFAQAMNLDRVTLNYKLNAFRPFTAVEIQKAIQLLNLDKKDIPLYFFN